MRTAPQRTVPNLLLHDVGHIYDFSEFWCVMLCRLAWREKSGAGRSRVAESPYLTIYETLLIMWHRPISRLRSSRVSHPANTVATWQVAETHSVKRTEHSFTSIGTCGILLEPTSEQLYKGLLKMIVGVLTHCGRVTQFCVFNTVKLGASASSS